MRNPRTLLAARLAALAAGCAGLIAAGPPAAAGPAQAPDPLLGGRWGPGPLVVDVVDRTGPAWPVHAASRAWSAGPVRYAYVPRCAPGAPCVVVEEHAAGPTGAFGVTRLWRGPGGAFQTPAVISMNDSYPATPTQRAHAACQELGHALGVGHSDRASSCMQEIGPGTGPDRGDLATVAALYR